MKSAAGLRLNFFEVPKAAAGFTIMNYSIILAITCIITVHDNLEKKQEIMNNYDCHIFFTLFTSIV